MRRAAAAGDARGEARIDATFHGRLIEIAANRTLERLWRYLEPASRTAITLAVPGLDAIRIVDLHQPILDALRRRDRDAVSEAVHRHFAVASGLFEELYDRPGRTFVPAGMGAA
jgi:DNA-binding GntR family transcriptional regulator